MEEGVKDWVQEVGKDNPFGAILVHNQVISTYNRNGTYSLPWESYGGEPFAIRVTKNKKWSFNATRFLIFGVWQLKDLLV